MKTFYWLVKREFWEHRGGFLWAPVITALIYLFLFVAGLVGALVFDSHHGMTMGGNDLHMLFKSADQGHLQQVSAAIDGFLLFSTAQILVVCGFVVLFYCLGALYDERRDRSVLFWKSLPISNTSTVLSKVVSACVIAPLISVVIGIVVAILQLVLFVLALSLHGIQAWQLLALAHPFRAAASFISMIPLSALWALPAIGWLMLCSAWVRSMPFLWAMAVPAITGLFLWWFGIIGFFGRSIAWYWIQIFLRAIGSVFPGSFLLWGETDYHLRNIGSSGEISDGNPLIALAPSNTYTLLASPNLWLGVVAGVVMIAGAIWFRRVRDDS